MSASRGRSLHDSAEKSCKVALLLIDVMNDMEFPGGKSLRRHAAAAAQCIARLKRRAQALEIPIIYVNDNFGRWQSDFSRQVERCLQPGVTGEPVARLLLPMAEDYFILKPKHSGFFSTPLDILLKHLGVETLILTGFATNLCVLYTAHDAYMNGLHIFVPSDCVAAERKELHTQALRHMQRYLRADCRSGARIPLRKLKTRQRAD